MLNIQNDSVIRQLGAVVFAVTVLRPLKGQREREAPYTRFWEGVALEK